MRRGGDRPGDMRGPDGLGGPGGMRDAIARDPKLLKEFIDRQLELLTRGTKRLEEARAELAAGTPSEEVFRKLREARAGAMAENFFANWRDRQPPGQPGQPGQPGMPGDGGPPGPEQLDELLAFVREIRPEFAAKLETWQKDEPKAFMLITSRLFHQARDTFRERDRDKQLYQLRKDDLRNNVLIVEKSAELRRLQAENKASADDAQFAKAKDELKQLMGQGYDSRVKVREYEAARLEARLKETRAQIQETKEVRAQMVDKAVEEVLARKRVSPQPGDGPGPGDDGRPRKKGPPDSPR